MSWTHAIGFLMYPSTFPVEVSFIIFLSSRAVGSGVVASVVTSKLPELGLLVSGMSRFLLTSFCGAASSGEADGWVAGGGGGGGVAVRRQ